LHKRTYLFDAKEHIHLTSLKSPGLGPAQQNFQPLSEENELM
jgi:hypothetical protein